METKYKKENLGLYIEQIRGISYKPMDIKDEPTEKYKVVLRANSIKDNKLKLEDLVYVKEELIKEKQILKKNDILVASSSGSKEIVGKSVKIPYDTDFSFGAFCKLIRCKNTIDANYVAYFFRTAYYRNTISNLVCGANINNLKNEHIDNLIIPVPEINIQKKIVEVLDKAQELIDKRKAQIEALDELVKSQFIEMFGEPISNPKGWNREKMNDVAPVVNYKGDFNEEKIWLLNLDMVESNTGKIIDYNYVMKNEIGSSTCTFDTTNVLYSKLRPYLNKVVIPNSIGYATSEMVPLQPLNSKINRYYLTYMLRNKSFVDYISEKVAGAKMPRVSMNDFRNFEVPIPPIELQNQFVDFVKQVDKLKFEMQESLKELEDNFNSLMQRAFKGELFN